jgi:hypothetical protein
MLVDEGVRRGDRRLARPPPPAAHPAEAVRVRRRVARGRVGCDRFACCRLVSLDTRTRPCRQRRLPVAGVHRLERLPLPRSRDGRLAALLGVGEPSRRRRLARRGHGLALEQLLALARDPRHALAVERTRERIGALAAISGAVCGRLTDVARRRLELLLGVAVLPLRLVDRCADEVAHRPRPAGCVLKLAHRSLHPTRGRSNDTGVDDDRDAEGVHEPADASSRSTVNHELDRQAALARQRDLVRQLAEELAERVGGHQLTPCSTLPPRGSPRTASASSSTGRTRDAAARRPSSPRGSAERRSTRARQRRAPAQRAHPTRRR